MQTVFAVALDRTLKHLKGQYTADQLAELSEVSDTVLSRFRNGKKQLETSTLEKIIMGLPIEGRRFYMREVFRLLDVPIYEDPVETSDVMELTELMIRCATRLRDLQGDQAQRHERFAEV